jgi:hypothetical protein
MRMFDEGIPDEQSIHPGLQTIFLVFDIRKLIYLAY